MMQHRDAFIPFIVNKLTTPLNFNGIQFLRVKCTQYISNVVINVAAIYRNAVIIIPVNTAIAII